MSIPMTTIKRKTVRVTEITVSCGPDPIYNLSILIDTSMVADDITPDGIDRPSSRLRLGGLNADESSEDKEVIVERWLGEDELREMGKALIAAAGKLRRIESDNRRRKTRRSEA